MFRGCGTCVAWSMTRSAGLWNDPATAHQVEKRIVRLLVEDVSLPRAAEVTMHVRLKGGVNRSLTLPVPLPYNDMRTTPMAVVELVDELRLRAVDPQLVSLTNLNRPPAAGHFAPSGRFR